MKSCTELNHEIMCRAISPHIPCVRWRLRAPPGAAPASFLATPASRRSTSASLEPGAYFDEQQTHLKLRIAHLGFHLLFPPSACHRASNACATALLPHLLSRQPISARVGESVCMYTCLPPSPHTHRLSAEASASRAQGHFDARHYAYVCFCPPTHPMRHLYLSSRATSARSI